MVGMGADRSAFERTFRAHHEPVYRYVLRRVERAAVDDVVAETFLAAWRRYEDLDGDPLPWLLGIARRVCANHLRGRARRGELAARLAAQPVREEPDLQPQVRDVAIGSALASLRDADREAILLTAWDGLENREAAAVLDCSVTTFAVRLHRARRRLRRALESPPTETDRPIIDAKGGVAHELP